MDDAAHDTAVLRKTYQPHWVWFVAFVVTPVALQSISMLLLIIGVLRIESGSLVPLGWAAVGPGIALSLSAVGMGAALIRRRKGPIQIAAFGLALSVTAYLLLWWVLRIP
jgi:hypothetical protein